MTRGCGNRNKSLAHTLTAKSSTVRYVTILGDGGYWTEAQALFTCELLAFLIYGAYIKDVIIIIFIIISII